jgi:hypothetical protein
LISGLFSASNKASNPGDESARSSSFSLYLQVDVGSTYTIMQWTLACLVEDFDPRCEEANNHERGDQGSGPIPMRSRHRANVPCWLSAPPHFPSACRFRASAPVAGGPALPAPAPVRSFWMHRGIPCNARFHAPAHSGSFITRSFRESPIIILSNKRPFFGWNTKTIRAGSLTGTEAYAIC